MALGVTRTQIPGPAIGTQSLRQQAAVGRSQMWALNPQDRDYRAKLLPRGFLFLTSVEILVN